MYLQLRSNCFIAAILFSFNLVAQVQFEGGPEIQGYPTGLIPGVNLGLRFSEASVVHLRIGYNIVRHRDLGVHEDERGGGPGFSLGYAHMLRPKADGWFLGVRSDLWFNEVDWRDGSISGISDVTVLQPTAQLGYRVKLGEGGTWFVPTFSFGAEINIKTDGAPVGEGAIVLLGAMLLFGR